MALEAVPEFMRRPAGLPVLLEWLANGTAADVAVSEFIAGVSEEEFDQLPRPVMQALAGLVGAQSRLQRAVNAAIREAGETGQNGGS